MNHIRVVFRRILFRALVAGTGLLFCGCSAFGPLAPEYPGLTEKGPAPSDMTKVEGSYMALPPGWSTQPTDESVADAVKVSFVKDGTTIHGKLLCHTPLMSRKQSGVIMRDAAQESSGNARVVRGPYALGDSVMAPVIERLEGTVTAKGSEREMGFWIAYNIEDLGCHYGLFVAGTPEDIAQIEPEIVAIVHSIR